MESSKLMPPVDITLDKNNPHENQAYVALRIHGGYFLCSNAAYFLLRKRQTMKIIRAKVIKISGKNMVSVIDK